MANLGFGGGGNRSGVIDHKCQKGSAEQKQEARPHERDDKQGSTQRRGRRNGSRKQDTRTQEQDETLS